MAKYEDYVKDGLDDEIAEAQKNQQERIENAEKGFEMPVEFQGKTAEEIAQSYVELQKLNSKQAQDLGAMRKSVDELITLQSQKVSEPPVEDEASETVTIDDLYDDPAKVIEDVAGKAVEGRIEELESRLVEAEVEKQLAQFETKHGDWKEVAASEEFNNWLSDSPYRTRLAQAADAFDFDAANDLFDMYAEHTGKAGEKAAEAEREQQLAAATLESSSPGTIDTDEEFSRSNLMEARIAAKKGDRAARQWLAENSEAIALAYEESRITD